MLRGWRMTSSWCCTFYFFKPFPLFGVLMPNGEKIVLYQFFILVCNGHELYMR
jgi:hypothetical protein